MTGAKLMENPNDNTISKVGINKIATSIKYAQKRLCTLAISVITTYLSNTLL